MNAATAAAAAAAAAKYHHQKISYSESIQECMRYVNNNSNNSQNNIINPNLDPMARQRLITNLMRQFNSNKNTNIYNNQTSKQLFNNSQLFNGFSSSPNDTMLQNHQQLSPSLIQSNNSSASSSIPSSPDTSNSSSPSGDA